MSRQSSKLITSTADVKIRQVNFRTFDKKPVNYFRDMIDSRPDEAVIKHDEASQKAAVELAIAEERRLQEQIKRDQLEVRYNEGVEAGKRMAEGQIAPAVGLLKEYAALLNAERKELENRLEQHAVSLAFELAKEILSAELAFDPDRVLNMIRSALQQAADSNSVTLRVSTADLERVKSHVPDWSQQFGIRAGIDLRSDSTLGPGDCLIETESGLTDARVSSQLETLRTNLAESLRHTK